MSLHTILQRALMRSVKIVPADPDAEGIARVDACYRCKYLEGDYGWRPSQWHHGGTCRRHAPIGIKDNKMGTPNAAMWPHVEGRDWCAEFELYVAPPKALNR